MKPDAVIKCVEDYSGNTRDGRNFTLNKDVRYFRTTTDNLILLNLYDQPSEQLPWFTPDEYSQLEGKYLEVESSM